jgi:hypothetical protein
MPLEVQLTHIVQLMGIVFLILAQVKHKVAVVPVGIIPLVHLATITLRSTARGVTTKTQSRILEVVSLTLGLKLCIAVDICRSVAITVILFEQVVPLLLTHYDTNLWEGVHIKDPVELSRCPRCVGIVAVVWWLRLWFLVTRILITRLLRLLCAWSIWEDRCYVLCTSYKR